MSVDLVEQILDTRTVQRFKGHEIECLSFARLERQYTPWAQLAIILLFPLLKALWIFPTSPPARRLLSSLWIQS